MENRCCPSSYKPEPNPDTLDYVFEHVESFTCKHEEKEPETSFRELEIHRDNSMVEFDGNGAPCPARADRKIKPIGQQGDALDYGMFLLKRNFMRWSAISCPNTFGAVVTKYRNDYVFENVERYACNETMPDDKTSMKSIAPATGQASQRSNPEHVDEPEDEIQLYFRPKRGTKRRSRKAAI
eukprot:CAMPEP_0176179924 /NCGR_PEP_ID=MMETSP0120_2-20121206/92192_1 /TAXON_ID=160619 /ORGANISM="Kryptoperidinium foliaceum, Strain CCMP 1326" /LENGTH=181 /DNA_ID=CAMNT_0017518117 /DNA_START=136 /DNA_END=682 /DNA_ORIENTATION=+